MIRPEIQHASISDRYAIAYIDQCAQVEAGRVQCSNDYIDPIFESSWEDRFDARRHSRSHRQILVAKHFGIVIGFTNFSFSDSRHCIVENIGVAEQYRNNGIGQALITAVVNEIPEPKEILAVEIPDHFNGSSIFFKQTGFEPSKATFRSRAKNNTRMTLDLSRC